MVKDTLQMPSPQLLLAPTLQQPQANLGNDISENEEMLYKLKFVSEFKSIKKKAKELGIYKIDVKHKWPRNKSGSKEKIVETHEYSIGREMFVKFPKDQEIIGYISK